MAVFVKVEYAVVCRSVRKEQFARVVGGSLRLSHLGLSGRFLALLDAVAPFEILATASFFRL